jgi:hypothetical protein
MCHTQCPPTHRNDPVIPGSWRFLIILGESRHSWVFKDFAVKRRIHPDQMIFNESVEKWVYFVIYAPPPSQVMGI